MSQGTETRVNTPWPEGTSRVLRNVIKNVQLIAQHGGETEGNVDRRHGTKVLVYRSRYSFVDLGTRRETEYEGLHHT